MYRSNTFLVLELFAKSRVFLTSDFAKCFDCLTLYSLFSKHDGFSAGRSHITLSSSAFFSLVHSATRKKKVSFMFKKFLLFNNNKSYPYLQRQTFYDRKPRSFSFLNASTIGVRSESFFSFSAITFRKSKDEAVASFCFLSYLRKSDTPNSNMTQRQEEENLGNYPTKETFSREIASTVYVNPVCMELDKLILKCTRAEDVLSLLVTHRGVYFVHNLVTTLRLLAEIASVPSNRNSEIKSESQKVVLNENNDEHSFLDELVNSNNMADKLVYYHGRNLSEAIIRDERYDMLLQDIIEFRYNLDFESICHIVFSLRSLKHKHYRLFGLLLQRLLKTDIGFSSLDWSLCVEGVSEEKDENAVKKNDLASTEIKEGNLSDDGGIMNNNNKNNCAATREDGGGKVEKGVARSYNSAAAEALKSKMSLLLKCAECYVWVGYLKHPFYEKCCEWISQMLRERSSHYRGCETHDEEKRVLDRQVQLDTCKEVKRRENGNSESSSTNAVASDSPPVFFNFSAPSTIFHLYPSLLIFAVRLFGSLETYNRAFFQEAASFLLDLVHSMASNRSQAAAFRQKPQFLLTSGGVTEIVVAFSRHSKYERTNDSILQKMSELISLNLDKFKITHLIKCITSFRKMLLHYERTTFCASLRIHTHLLLAYNLRQPSSYAGLTVSDLCSLLEALAFFQKPPIEVKQLCILILSYIQDFIDEIDEISAIRSLFTLSALSLYNSFWYLLSFLYRKVGSTTAWESQKYLVFQLWLCHVIQFPLLEHNLHPRCLYQCLRAWCLQRGGYGSLFPKEINEISECLKQLSISNRSHVQIDFPYVLDIVLDLEEEQGVNESAEGKEFRKTRSNKIVILVTNETSRNSFVPCGGALLVIEHLKQINYDVHVINKSLWNSMKNDEKLNFLKRFINSILCECKQS